MHSDFFANFSMRSRLLALAILIIIIGIPAGIYWYFFSRNTASLTISVGSDVVFSVRLEGVIDNESLPLADRLIFIERECRATCVISPIAPIKYNLSLKSDSKTSIQDTIVINIWEDKEVAYTLSDEVQLELMTYTLKWDSTLAAPILANANNNTVQTEYTLIGIDSENTVYAERDAFGRRELGILTMDRFAPLYTVPSWVGTIALDKTWQYFLAPVLDRGTLILSLDMQFQREIPVTNVTWYVRSDNEEKIYTQSWTISLFWNKYVPNPRFTDWIDISWDMRIGYIASDDIDRLSLSNIVPRQSVLVSVDRRTWESLIIQRWLDIDMLMYIDSVPVYVDQEGKIWKITL